MDPPPPPPDEDDIPPPPPPPIDDEDINVLPVVLEDSSEIKTSSPNRIRRANRKPGLNNRRHSSRSKKNSTKSRKASSKIRKGSSKPGKSSRFVSSPRPWKKRFFSLEQGTLVVYEDDEADDPLCSITLINATVYSWHRLSGRYLFCITAEDEDYTHFFEAENSRLRKQWLKWFHDHGANIVEPPNEEKYKSSIVHCKGWLRLYHVSTESNEGNCQPELVDLCNIATIDMENEWILSDAPTKGRELANLRRTIRDAKEKENRAKKTASSAVAQMREAERLKNELKTNLEQAQERSEASKLRDSEELKNLERDKIGKERELARLQKLSKDQEKRFEDMRNEIPKMKKRAAELESQRAAVLQQTIDHVEVKVMTDGLDNRTDDSWGNILMDPSSPDVGQSLFDQQSPRESLRAMGDDVIKNNIDSQNTISELTDTINQQAREVEELNNVQLEMDGQMILLEKEKTKLQQILNRRRGKKKN